MDNADSAEFRVPVDYQGKLKVSTPSVKDLKPFIWLALGLLDYPTIIKHPMDLGTVKAKI